MEGQAAAALALDADTADQTAPARAVEAVAAGAAAAADAAASLALQAPASALPVDLEASEDKLPDATNPFLCPLADVISGGPAAMNDVGMGARVHDNPALAPADSGALCAGSDTGAGQTDKPGRRKAPGTKRARRQPSKAGDDDAACPQEQPRCAACPVM
jgi:hypothetical protein